MNITKLTHIGKDGLTLYSYTLPEGGTMSHVKMDDTTFAIINSENSRVAIFHLDVYKVDLINLENYN